MGDTFNLHDSVAGGCGTRATVIIYYYYTVKNKTHIENIQFVYLEIALNQSNCVRGVEGRICLFRALGLMTINNNEAQLVA